MTRFRDYYGDLRLWVILTLFGGAFFGTILLMVVAIVGIGRWQGRIVCRNWSKQTGIVTKFRILNFTDSGTCFARTPDGRWIVNSQWTTFVQGQK